MKIELTKAAIAAAPGPPEGSKLAYALHSFHGFPGLGLRVTRAGHRAFTEEYGTRDGRKPRMTIGDVADWPPKELIEEHRRIRRLVDQGEDPSGERQAQCAAPTFTDLVQLWREDKASKKLRPRTRDEYEALLRRSILPTFGKLKVAAIERDDVERLHQKIKKPTEANHAVGFVHRLLGLAKLWKMYTGDNPATGIERNKEYPRVRFMESDELQRLIPAVESCSNRDTRDAITALLFSGARKSEILSLTWDELSFDRSVMTKEHDDNKQDDLHVRPLSPPLMELFLRRKAEAEAGPTIYHPSRCPWVFHNRKGDGPITDIHNAWATILKRAGISNLRLHDLRHCYATYLASSGLSLPIIGRLLGHRQAATTARYAHFQHDPLREANDRVAARIEAARTGESGTIVRVKGGSAES